MGPPVRPVLLTKRPKGQRKKHDSGKLDIRRDHPRRRIEMKFCMVGGLRFEFHQNRASGFGTVGEVEISSTKLCDSAQNADGDVFASCRPISS